MSGGSSSIGGGLRVVAALLQEGDRVLVQQRLPTGRHGLKWEFPGGKVEPGEGDAEALTRECLEELDLQIAVDDLAWTCVHAYPDLKVELLLYRCRRLAGEPKPLAAHAVRFQPISRLHELDFLEADLPLIARLQAGELDSA